MHSLEPRMIHIDRITVTKNSIERQILEKERQDSVIQLQQALYMLQITSRMDRKHDFFFVIVIFSRWWKRLQSKMLENPHTTYKKFLFSVLFLFKRTL